MQTGMCFIAWSAARRSVGTVFTRIDDVRNFSCCCCCCFSFFFFFFASITLEGYRCVRIYALWRAECNGRQYFVLSDARMNLCVCVCACVHPLSQLESANEDQIDRIQFIRWKHARWLKLYGHEHQTHAVCVYVHICMDYSKNKIKWPRTIWMWTAAEFYLIHSDDVASFCGEKIQLTKTTNRRRPQWM